MSSIYFDILFQPLALNLKIIQKLFQTKRGKAD